MTELSNAKRSFFQATYVPYVPRVKKVADLPAGLNPKSSNSEKESPTQAGGAFEKVSLIQSLQMSRKEANDLTKRLEASPKEKPSIQGLKEVLLAISLVADSSVSGNAAVVLNAASILYSVPVESLEAVVMELAELRRLAQSESDNKEVELKGSQPTKEQSTLSSIGTIALLNTFRLRSEILPVGYLHLERLSYIPAGIERGELVHSIPLSPGEETNVTHRQWATTSEEFDRIIADYEENFSERGVAEKTDLSLSTSSQHQHSMGLNTGVTASASYGPVSVVATASLTLNDSAAESAQTSRNNSMSVTRKASARSKKENKISFRTASAAGTEDQTVQLIKNPFKDKATRVDFYQLIRRWLVNHHRYGIRLTYDITIPEPGREILTKIKEIEELRGALAQRFSDPSATLDWVRFNLRPTDITAETVDTYAGQYGASVPSTPAEYISFEKSDFKNWNHDESNASEFHTLDINVPDGYIIDSAEIQEPITQGQGRSDNEVPTFYVYPPDFYGRGGTVTVLWRSWRLSSAFVKVTGRFKITPEAKSDWQRRAWAAIRDSAQARYYERHQTLQERLDFLTQGLAADDALTLRKIEREEIMKGVMRWMFGPAFERVLEESPSLDFETDRIIPSPEERSRVASLGEIIKFLHHAIEWENVLYILYPYFWSERSNWDTKKYLVHPDPLHRVFLKAGSARVVLTIRPGYEHALVHFLDTATFGELTRDSPYFGIVTELEAYASTHYPGIPNDNAELADTREQGELIGHWYEYTPTSALDIAFGEALPTA